MVCMAETRDLSEFATKNQEALRSLLIKKCGAWISDDTINDHIQDIYIDMHKYDVLSRYDKSKGSFDRWITTIVSWHLSKDKDHRSRKHMATETIDDNTAETNEEAKALKNYIDDYVGYLKRVKAPWLTEVLYYLRARVLGYSQDEIDMPDVRKIIAIHNTYLRKYHECS